MSTVKQPLKMLWSVTFKDGYIIDQSEDDRYSKHDDKSEWNPSSFRDILDHEEKSTIQWFHLLEKKITRSNIYSLNLETGDFSLNGVQLRLEDNCKTPRKLIYYRNIEKDYVDGEEVDERIVSYNFGYEYKDEKGKVQKKVITLNG